MTSDDIMTSLLKFLSTSIKIHVVKPLWNLFGQFPNCRPNPSAVVVSQLRILFTPPTPTRLNTTVESCRRRRCVLGISRRHQSYDRRPYFYASTPRSPLVQPDRQWRSSSFQESKKVRVSRDLWRWPWPWAHPGCMLTWSPSCESLVAIRPFAWEKKRFAQKFTDRQTDRQTDDGRFAIV